jgi:hypothetical protein
MLKLRILGVMSALATLLVASAAGATTIGFSPASQAGGIGDPVSFDIVVSDLGGEIVSSYDLDVSFDETVLQADDVSFTTALGDPDFLEVLLGFDLTTPGLADLSGLSLLDDADLLALQGGDSVTLATLDFTVIGPGTSSLDFVFGTNSGITGANGAFLDVTPVSGVLVPEPSSLLLLASGALLAATAARLRPDRSR